MISNTWEILIMRKIKIVSPVTLVTKIPKSSKILQVGITKNLGQIKRSTRLPAVVANNIAIILPEEARWRKNL